MEFKLLATLFAVVFFKIASARRQCLPILPTPQPTTLVEIQNLATLGPCNCVQKFSQRRDELILPPARAELPRGLGYFPAAIPLVASFYKPAVEVPGLYSEASIPVTSPCNGATLAVPPCPDLAPLIRSIIL